MLKRLILILSSLCFFNAESQNLDSLLAKSLAMPDDTVKFHLLIDVAVKYENKGDYDRGIILANKAREVAQNIQNTRLSIDAGCRSAKNYINQNDFTFSKKLLDSLLLFSKKTEYTIGEGSCYRYLAQIKLFEGDYQKATELYLDAQRKWEESKNQKKIATGYSDLGTINYYRGQLKAAIDYYNRSAEIDQAQHWDEDLASDLNNIGLVLLESKAYDEAENKFRQSLLIHKKLNLSIQLCNNYNNLIKLEHARKNIAKAILYCDTVLKISLEVGDQSEIGTAYSNLSELYRSNKQPHKSIDYGKKALAIAKELKDYVLLSYVYNNLAYSFNDLKQADSAFAYMTEFMAVKDTLLNLENTKQIVELEKKFELGQKEKENQLLNQQIRVQEVESSRLQILIISICSILCFLAVVAFILIRQNRQKNKTNLQLAQKNEIIEEKNKIVETQNKDITDSIRYAERIQHAFFPPDKLWYTTFPDSFVYFEPKDILSGDFYWMEETPDHTFLAVADCTGHGVPGALISIINYNLLNKAVLEKNLSDPADILNAVNSWLTQALHQSFNEATVKDGMDITLLSFNKKTKAVKFAGAMNPIYVISGQTL
ncbi:MAG: tetratricopeptide repeat protein, partial [Bacteroidia bacterium]